MDFYRFAVTQFYIRGTRARDTDTLRLSHAAYVNGDRVANDFVSLGDFGSGSSNDPQQYAPGGRVGLSSVVINDPLAQVAFNFQLINAGNTSGQLADARTIATSDQLAGIAAGLGGADGLLGASALPVALGIEAFANFWTWLTVDCDGPVAADQISGPRYVIDAWADDDPTGTTLISRSYLGSDSPEGCGINSAYDVTWLLQHWRGWKEITSEDGSASLASATGISAAAHNGAVHVFGVDVGANVSHARTFTGASWYIDQVGAFDLAPLPVSAVSFNERLYVFGVHSDGSVAPLAFTVDGGAWATPKGAPPSLATAQAIATVVYRNRLHLFARDSVSGALRFTSTSDLLIWSAWQDVPPVGPAPRGPVVAAALEGVLHVFGVADIGKPPRSHVVVHNSTADGVIWAGWDVVESGARPEWQPDTDQPLDVSATTFEDRVYLTSRWQPDSSAGEPARYAAVNFSADGSNWSGWRQPPATVETEPAAVAGLAGVGNHLYIVAPTGGAGSAGNLPVWAH